MVAQLVKHWSADLAVMGLIPATGGNSLNHKWECIAHSLSLLPSHHSNMTEIHLLLKRA